MASPRQVEELFHFLEKVNTRLNQNNQEKAVKEEENISPEEWSHFLEEMVEWVKRTYYSWKAQKGRLASFHNRERVSKESMSEMMAILSLLQERGKERFAESWSTISSWLKKISHSREFRSMRKECEKKSKKAAAAADSVTPEAENNEEQALEDFQEVKDDREYELFYLQKEDGLLFPTEKIKKKLRIICGLTHHLTQYHRDDPLIQIKLWEDQKIQNSAQSLLSMLSEPIAQYRRSIVNFTKFSVVVSLNQALLALKLSAYVGHALYHHPKKSCYQYFGDFLSFLQNVLTSSDYLNFQSHFMKQHPKTGEQIQQLVRLLCEYVYTVNHSWDHYKQVITQFLEQADSRQDLFSVASPSTLDQQFSFEYKALLHLFERHPNGPLFKNLDLILEGNPPPFDPFNAMNLPCTLFRWTLNNQATQVLYLPSPTVQRYVDRAELSPIFQELIRSYQETSKVHLLLNLQDRNSWKSSSRCFALEQLNDSSENAVIVATLGFCAPVFFQSEKETVQAEDFFDEFSSQLYNNSPSLLLPDCWRKKGLNKWMESIFERMHRLFFASKKQLTVEERCDFSDLFYLFLAIKGVKDFSPASFSFTCKDGVDRSAMMTSLLFYASHWLNQKPLSKEEKQFLRMIYFMPAITVRERLPSNDFFQRFHRVLRHLENASTAVKKEKIEKSWFI